MSQQSGRNRLHSPVSLILIPAVAEPMAPRRKDPWIPNDPDGDAPGGVSGGAGTGYETPELGRPRMSVATDRTTLERTAELGELGDAHNVSMGQNLAVLRCKPKTR